MFRGPLYPMCARALFVTKSGGGGTHDPEGFFTCSFDCWKVYALRFTGSNVPENLNLDQSTLNPLPFETNKVVAHMIRKASSHVVATAGRCTFYG